MTFEKLSLPGLVLITPTVHGDDRGFFMETYRESDFLAAGIAGPFVQDNHSRSGHAVLRGLHVQQPYAQGKLVRVIAGEVFDVAVDTRPGSATFGAWEGVVLSSENRKQLWVPPGFAHGFCVLTDFAEFAYKCTEYYHPETESSILWNDPSIGIAWPIDMPVLSERDRNGITLDHYQRHIEGLGLPERTP